MNQQQLTDLITRTRTEAYLKYWKQVEPYLEKRMRLTDKLLEVSLRSLSPLQGQ
jgi:hypothetical protein